MSKSLGNGIDPDHVINGGKNQKTDPPYGVDVARIWATSGDFTTDVSIGPNALKTAADQLRKIRNSAKFMLGCLNDFTAGDVKPVETLFHIDQYLLHRLSELTAQAEQAYDAYDFLRVNQLVQSFVTQDLSSFFFEISKVGLLPFASCQLPVLFGLVFACL
eukprot:m.212407 g.212407  ORF g.212407 m.212407 type:complete len:161 (-) comp10753_c1_seq12:4611-5093(-)